MIAATPYLRYAAICRMIATSNGRTVLRAGGFAVSTSLRRFNECV